jgi:UDP:flavonoid glycosyltransferase YjiC (YdhE family)
MTTGKRRVLFFAEPATLAHVTRSVVLAATLDPNQYHVELATGPDFQRIAADARLVVRELGCIGTKAYLAAVAAGRVVFPYPVLERYVREDLRLIEEFEPDLVVGDFRLSLAVSTRLASVPYVAISNAYWSPFSRGRAEIPVHFSTRLLGPRVANAVFRVISPLVLAHHSLPMHRLRKKYGMPSLGFDLRRVFSEGDLTLFADVPELVPTDDGGSSARYRYIGPVVWSPKTELPAALTQRSDRDSLVYISMGSSGDSRLILEIAEAVRSLGCRPVVITTRELQGASFPEGTITADFLPGGQVAAMSRLVICNGGSPGSHQALQQGTPVLGIPANLDQLLNMQFVVASGAGLSLRGDRASRSNIRSVVNRLLTERSFRTRAERVSEWFRAYDPTVRFPEAVGKALG